MKRRVTREWLDELPAQDPRAIRSRRELRRVNAWMGNGAICRAALQGAFSRDRPRRLVDLGAGDGTWLLAVARRMAPWADGTHALLVDKQALVGAQTRAEFKQLGWTVQMHRQDVFTWLAQEPAGAAPVIVANLFLHHFPERQLAELLRAAGRCARGLIAIDPRRSPVTLGFGRLLWCIGCREVTRHDAVASIRAGFTGNELSRLWSADGRWVVSEQPRGCFSHLFWARRCGA